MSRPTAVRWAVIPARFDSSRLPGKPLADVCGWPMLRHVWSRVVRTDLFDRVTVATDDDRIADVARGFGAEVACTGPAPSGTHRVALALGDHRPDVVVNVQGDQPLISEEHLAALVQAVRPGEIATLAAPGMMGAPGPEVVRVVTDGRGRARDFRRLGPCERVHVGVYAFGQSALGRAVSAPISARSRRLQLEQLAWMDAGLPIQVVEVDRRTPSVDTPVQLDHVRRLLAGRPHTGA